MARLKLQPKYSQLLVPRKGVIISRPVQHPAATKAVPLSNTPGEEDHVEVDVGLDPAKKRSRKQTSPKKGGVKPKPPKPNPYPGFPDPFAAPWLDKGTHSGKPDKDAVDSKLAFESDHLSALFGLPSLYHLRYLELLLRNGGRRKPRPILGDGDCMWSAIRRQMDIPGQFTNPMLRREVVSFVLAHADSLFPLLKKFLTNMYGVEDPTGEVPGPFSVCSYLSFLLEDGSWGDTLVLNLLSRMWGARITVILAPNMSEERIRHDQPLAEADIVLIMSGRHYSSTCEYSRMSYFFHSDSSYR